MPTRSFLHSPIYRQYRTITYFAIISRQEQYEPAARGTFSASSDKYVLVVCQIRLRPSLPKSARKITPCGAMQFYRELILGEDKAKTQFIQGYERGFQRKIAQNQPRKIRFVLFLSASISTSLATPVIRSPSLRFIIRTPLAARPVKRISDTGMRTS